VPTSPKITAVTTPVLIRIFANANRRPAGAAAFR
jgi:hypothetical protein